MRRERWGLVLGLAEVVGVGGRGGRVATLDGDGGCSRRAWSGDFGGSLKQAGAGRSDARYVCNIQQKGWVFVYKGFDSFVPLAG